MFSVGEVIIYGTQGICKIKEITTMKMGREKKDYYVLCPVYNEGSSIFVPADNEVLLNKMRCIATSDEIQELIGDIKENRIEWISDDDERKEYCSCAIKSGDRKEIMRVIGMLYAHQEEVKAQKKHFHISDEHFLKEAEKLIHDEFAYVLGIPKDEVPDYIRSRI